MSDIEETNSGVKKKGDWEEVSRFGEEVEEEMEKTSMDDETVEEFEEWRPKSTEAENDMEQKTVDKASIDRRKVEERSKGVKDDVKKASAKMAEAGRKAAKRKNPESEISEASLDILRSFAARSTEIARQLEKRIYSGIMLKFNPFYLDTQAFTVDFRATRDGDYEMDVNVNEKEQRKKIKQRFEEKE